MPKTLRAFKARALARPAVRTEYDKLADEFAFLDEILKARAQSGLSQADVAARMGTTQSAIARFESTESGHSPSIATLQRYATALGYKLQLRLVKQDATSGRYITRNAGMRSTKARSKTVRAT